MRKRITLVLQKNRRFLWISHQKQYIFWNIPFFVQVVKALPPFTSLMSPPLGSSRQWIQGGLHGRQERFGHGILSFDDQQKQGPSCFSLLPLWSHLRKIRKKCLYGSYVYTLYMFWLLDALFSLTTFLAYGRAKRWDLYLAAFGSLTMLQA